MKLFASLSKRSVDPDGPGFIGGLSGRPGSVRWSFRLTPYALLLTLCFASSLFSQWEPDQRLSYSTNSYTCRNNAKPVTANGLRVHVVWDNYQSNQDSIFYKRSTDGGDTWESATVLSGTGVTSPEYPAIARSGSGSPETESLYVVWRGAVVNTDSIEIFFNRSTDGGTTWGSVSRLTRDTCYSETPSIAASGPFVHVASNVNRESPLGTKGAFEILYQRSTNGGATWGQDTCLSKKDNWGSEWPSIGVSGDTVHLVWNDYQDSSRINQTIHYRRSTDGGTTWESEKRLTTYPAWSGYPSIAVAGSMVHVVCMNDTNQGDSDIYDIRSTDGGTTWEIPKLVMVISANFLPSPSVAVSGSNVYVAYRECRHVPSDNGEIHMKYSPDNGTTWLSFCRLTTDTAYSWYPSVAASDTLVHVVWADSRDHSGWSPPTDIYYKHYRSGSGRFPGHLTIPSQGRHVVRDPTSRSMLHLVMQGEDKMIYYTRSSDNGSTWVVPETLGLGLNPSVGLAQLPEDVYPYYYALCVAYSDTNNYQLIYQWNDGYDDPGTGDWDRDTLTPAAYPLGAPALTAFNTRVYVTYAANSYLYCDNFEYNLPDSFQRQTLDNSGSASQPSMAYDGQWTVHAAWKRGSQVYYCARDANGNWPDSMKLRVDYSADSSQHPFVECYGDSAFVVWADSTPFEIRRASKDLPYLGWRVWRNISISSNIASESPTQAWQEFVNWAEGRPTQGMFDIKYWRSTGDTGIVEPNPTLWSYWPHVVKWDSWFWGTYLFTAWTESPTPNQPPYTVMTKLPFGGGFGGSGSGFLTGSPEYGIYYQVQAGQDAPSPYCRKRDGVMKFEGKAVDFARDSLVYEFRYLDPKYDYLVKVSSYREEGVNWTQGLSVDGRAVKSVKFASNKVDTAWFKIPPVVYANDHRAAFALKNVKGDYVTNLGLTLYQRDPWRSGKGGPQVGAPVDPVYREVFAVYPNPSKGEAQVVYSLRVPGKVDLSIYDVTGRMVRKLVDGSQPAGVHKVTWDSKDALGRKVSNGIYFVRLSSPERVKTVKAVVLR